MTNTTTNTQNTNTTTTASAKIYVDKEPIQFKGATKDANTLSINLRLDLKLVAGDWSLWEQDLIASFDDAIKALYNMVNEATDGQIVAGDATLAAQAIRKNITTAEKEFYIEQKAAKEVEQAIANAPHTVAGAMSIAKLIAKKEAEIRKMLEAKTNKFNLHYIKADGEIMDTVASDAA